LISFVVVAVAVFDFVPLFSAATPAVYSSCSVTFTVPQTPFFLGE